MMKISVGVVALSIVSLLSASPTGLAQEKAPRRERPDAVRRPVLRDEAFRMIDAYLLSNLQESLSLTDDQFAKALPLVKRLNEERRKVRMARLEALRALSQRLESGTATEEQVSRDLAALREADAALRLADERNLAALDAVLTPLQQAKFRVLEYEVDRRMRNLIDRAGGAPAAPSGRPRR